MGSLCAGATCGWGISLPPGRGLWAGIRVLGGGCGLFSGDFGGFWQDLRLL